MIPRCKTCMFFWHDKPGEPFGECRKNAPTMREDGFAMWPATSIFDSCGDHVQEFAGQEVKDEDWPI